MAVVKHVINTGLKAGKYYKVFVTQVNTAGLESPKTYFDTIRVGDVTPPPVPGMTLNTAYGVKGFQKRNGLVDIGLCLYPEISGTCDDLNRMILYVWYTGAAYTGDGVYDKANAGQSDEQYILTSGATQYTLTGQKNQKRIYLGLQSEDISGNLSNIYVMAVTPEDNTTTETPDETMTLTPGVWCISVKITCPQSNELASVIYYRDNKTQLSPVTFHSGLVAEIVDQLGVEDGLTHFYTYCYVDKNGNKTERSGHSAECTAKTIDTTMWDENVYDVLKDMYGTDMQTIAIDKITEALASRDKTIAELATSLKEVTDNFSAMYADYQLIAKKIELMSPNFTQNADGTYTVNNTSYKQDSDFITMKNWVNNWEDNVSGQFSNLISNYTSEFRVGSKSVSTVVSEVVKNLNTAATAGSNGQYTHAYASITVMANGIQQKVSKGTLQSEIDQTASTIRLKASKIVIEGDCFADGTINAKKLMQGSISLDQMMQQAWTPHWKEYVLIDAYKNITWPSEYPSSHKNANWCVSTPSLGGIQYFLGQGAWSIPGCLFEMNVRAITSCTVIQILRVCDDDFRMVVNGVSIGYTEAWYGTYVISYRLQAGNNLLQFLINNKHGGACELVLQGDIIDNYNVFFNGNGTV